MRNKLWWYITSSYYGHDSWAGRSVNLEPIQKYAIAEFNSKSMTEIKSQNPLLRKDPRRLP